MKKLTRVVFIILGSIGFMYFTEWGNFHPLSFGFYWSILTATIIIISIDWLIPKLQKRSAEELGKQIKFQPQNGEKLAYESFANHKKMFEYVGGKLLLTNKRLVFKSHKLNIQNHEDEFDLSRIENVQALNGKKLSFSYKGRKEKFIVDSPEEWLNKLSF